MWETGKKHRFYQTVHQSIYGAKRKKNSLLKRLRNIYRTVPSQTYLQSLAGDLRKQLFQIEIQEVQGIKICAKVKYELEAEKCSKLFFSVNRKTQRLTANYVLSEKLRKWEATLKSNRIAVRS